MHAYSQKHIHPLQRLPCDPRELLLFARASTTSSPEIIQYLFWRIPGVSTKMSCVFPMFFTPSTEDRVVLTL